MYHLDFYLLQLGLAGDAGDAYQLFLANLPGLNNQSVPTHFSGDLSYLEKRRFIKELKGEAYKINLSDLAPASLLGSPGGRHRPALLVALPGLPDVALLPGSHHTLLSGLARLHGDANIFKRSLRHLYSRNVLLY